MNKINRIEALIDGIGKLNGMGDPESECYSLRSPLLLRSFAQPGKHEIDDKGRRVFSSFLNGYKAAVYDVEKKLSGLSRAGLAPTDKLENLLAVYEVTSAAAMDNVISFIRRALKDQSVTRKTELSFFLEQ